LKTSVYSYLEITVALHYKLMRIINDNSWVVNKLEASLIDNARVVIYDCHMYIVQVSGCQNFNLYLKAVHFFNTSVNQTSVAA
jgi:hypothetical protein